METKQKNKTTKQERQELRRKEKETIKKSKKRDIMFKKYTKQILSFIGIGVVLYGLVFITQQSENIRPGQSVPIQGRNHIPEDSPTPTYNSNPPTSGPHASPVNGGFYSGEVKDINVIHNLEHGFVWITYKNISNEIVVELEKIGQEFSGSVVISSREKNDSSIALVSWGRLQKIDAKDFNRELIINFIKSNRNRSPELLAR